MTEISPEQTGDVDPNRLLAMRELSARTARLFVRHSAGTGGIVKALSDDLVTLTEAYARVVEERARLRRKLAGVARALADAQAALYPQDEDEEGLPDAAG